MHIGQYLITTGFWTWLILAYWNWRCHCNKHMQGWGN